MLASKYKTSPTAPGSWSKVTIPLNNIPPEGAVAKITGKEGEIFEGPARIYEDEFAAIKGIKEEVKKGEVIVIRYSGPKGAPGMPEMLDSTSRITALCRDKGIVVGLMTDGRFSGGSVGLVIGHVGPEAAAGGSIALIKNGDEIIVDLNKNEWERLKKANLFRRLWTLYQQNIDLIQVGAYEPGSNPELDEAIKLRLAMEGFLLQGDDENVSFEQSQQMLMGIMGI
mgnify:CR=1 FL=1